MWIPGLAAALLAVDVYSWVDDEGVRHFSDAPIAEAVKTEVEPVHAMEPFSAPLRKPVERSRREQRADPAASVADERRRRCLDARQLLRDIAEERRRGYDIPRGRQLDRMRRNALREIDLSC